MPKNKNKQKKGKKRRPRKKHPELGRAKAVSKPAPRNFNQKELNKKRNLCPICNKRHITYVTIGGENVKNICDCNKYLVDEALERIRKRKQEKINARPIKPGQIRIINYTP